MNEDYSIFIYGAERLPVGLDVLEDDIFDRIEGQGDVTGTGTGERGWNIDLGFESLSSLKFVVRESKKVLQRYGVVNSVIFDINGTRYRFSELESKLGL